MTYRKYPSSDELSDEIIGQLLRRLRDPRLSPLEQYRENSEVVRYVDHVPDQELRKRLRNGYAALVKRLKIDGY